MELKQLQATMDLVQHVLVLRKNIVERYAKVAALVINKDESKQQARWSPRQTSFRAIVE
jgi:hypothetical protein